MALRKKAMDAGPPEEVVPKGLIPSVFGEVAEEMTDLLVFS
jgi:hypothetical protein